MIEVDTIVSCKSKEQENIEKFRRMQNIVYLTDATITAAPIPSEIQLNKAPRNKEAPVRLVKGVDYVPLTDNDFVCMYGVKCRDNKLGKCKYQHSPHKADKSVCRRGPDCPFLKQGKCAFIH